MSESERQQRRAKALELAIAAIRASSNAEAIGLIELASKIDEFIVRRDNHTEVQ